MIKANDKNGQESGLRVMMLKFKKSIEGPAQLRQPAYRIRYHSVRHQ